MGYSILRYREIPLYMLHLCGTVSKGNQVNIPEVGRGFVVTLNKLGDVGIDSWKSYLFFLTVLLP